MKLSPLKLVINIQNTCDVFYIYVSHTNVLVSNKNLNHFIIRVSFVYILNNKGGANV